MAQSLRDIELSETVSHSQIRTETLRDKRDFARHWDQIEDLRSELNGGDDVQLDPSHFLATMDDKWRSCSVACWHGDRLIGVVYAIEHLVGEVGIGYAFGGDYSGRGMLLCQPVHEAAVVQASIERIMVDGVHSLHMRFLPMDDSKPELAGMDMKFAEGLIAGDRIALLSTFDEFLGTLGKHTRRNVRYYMRKAEAEGIEFAPSLTKLEYRIGVERLNAASMFPVKPSRLARDERLLALHCGSQRHGLVDRHGNLIAVLCGFTWANRFYLMMQINDVHFEQLSLSLVLRGHSVQHLIASGHTELQFMGGSSPMFSRYCIPQVYRSIFIDKKTGVVAAAKRLSGTIVELVAKKGRDIPEAVQTLCGSNLQDERLIDRTPLGSVEVAFAKRDRSLEHSEHVGSAG